MSQWAEIRHLHLVEGVPKKEIARRLQLDVKTVRRAVDQSTPPVRVSPPRVSSLDPWRDRIEQWLREDRKLTAKRIRRLLLPLAGAVSQRTVRLKLASELTRSGNVYVMDEPTTGLHPADIDRLLTIVDRLIVGGNTVVVIEHNLDVIAAADWIVDLGPEGGKGGGAIVAEGTPETIAAHRATSHTGRYLKERLAEPPDRTAAAIPSAMASIPDAGRR